MKGLAVIHPNLGEDMLDFFELIADGAGPLNAALAVGWTPRKLRELSKNPEFAEMMLECQERCIESIEQKARELARKGNMTAIQLVLFCQAPERGWRPPTQRVAVSQNIQVKHEVVEAAKAAVLHAIDQRGVKALQPGGLDDIEEADVVG